MCGICGFVGLGSSDELSRMTSRLVHRGPDDSGTWFSQRPPLQLSNQRLSVIDLPGGRQPMVTRDGKLVIVFNGEIYNAGQLRQELQSLGHKFATDHSDTEVLLLGYREWKSAIVNRLNGMWAFALYDVDRATLFCSRDRFGKKPFYYTRSNGVFVFASELTALAGNPNVIRSISRRAMLKYFAYGYVPSPLSIYDGVSKLPGGCSLHLDVHSLQYRIERYWDFVLEPFEDIPRDPEEEWGAQLHELLDRAVKRRLVADVPIGILLSGGIDSSAVTAFAARNVAEGVLKTFSIGFKEDTFDETSYGRDVSAKFKTDHHVGILSLERAGRIIPDTLSKLDEPIGDNSFLPTSFLSEFTRQQVKVALGGDGGDELFAGYDPFQALRRSHLYQTICPRPVHAAIKAIFNRLPVSHGNMSLDFKIKRALRGLSYEPRFWAPVWMAPLDLPDLEELFNERLDPEDLYSEAIEQWDNCRQTNMVDKTIQFYTKLYLQDDVLAKVDRASMMHSLEVRTPFLDVEVVDFARRIPSDYKLRHGKTKYILTKALAGVLPAEILRRRKKGFGAPVGEWFKSGALSIDDSQLLGLNAKFIQRKVAAHLAGMSDERSFLWSFYVLTKWRQANSAS
jgi:asparagine synthase (glutamine-hydrolysing)